MKILAIGDVVGEQTLDYLRRTLPTARRTFGADLVIANGENVCDVHGLSPRCAEALFDAGVDFITSGNHIFDRRDTHQLLEDAARIIRPCNYPAECPGNGYTVFDACGVRILIMNVAGNIYSNEPMGCPFEAVERALNREKGRYDVAVLDVHAETTSEKAALARYFDGRINVVYGTHTHVQTADEKILPEGTAYITDLGLTGVLHQVIGSRPDRAIERQLTQLPMKSEIAEGKASLQGVIIESDPKGKAVSIERFTY
jgi:metallophosphoesterase (TIGR00282 family)